MQQKKLPIGYYLKQADSSLTSGINKIQSQFGLTRVEWQVLNTINERGKIQKNEIIEFMKPIADAEHLEAIINKLVDGEKAVVKDEIVSLTDGGIVLHRLCHEAQMSFRKKAMTDISDEEYRTTIQTLDKLIKNIEQY